MPLIVIGTTTIDSIRFLNEEKTVVRVGLRFGGVCNNVACALGNIGLAPIFISTRYVGELGASIGIHFKNNHVNWQPIEQHADLPFYQADINPQGEVIHESFIDTTALKLLTPITLQNKLREFSTTQALVTCTDLDLSSLLYIQDRASALGTELWLLSSSSLEVSKFRVLAPLSGVGMNLSELSQLCGTKLTSFDRIAQEALKLVSNNGACLVTMGSRGSLLCIGNPEKAEVFYQSVPPIVGKSPIAAGDVLFACLLGNRLKKLAWGDALHAATASTIAFIREAGELSPYNTLANPSIELDPPERFLP
jgi:sugar/nucleoside kinase (ribokinase family)